jgi:prepilin-type N-terminal cleavage/methylation domain-containing protein
MHRRLQSHRSHPSRAGFTIVELLAATAVLTVLLLIVSQMVSSTSRTVGHDERRLDSDANARMTFDRMQMDFDGMPKRGDLDVSFRKTNGKSGSFFFYSQAPGSTTAAAADRNTLSLVGYAVDSEYRLDRYGRGLQWDGGANNSVNFLTFAAGNLTPEDQSTIDGSFGTDLEPPTTTVPNDPWQILSDSVFRMEICFLLKDGSYSTYPAIGVTSTASPQAGETVAGTRAVAKGSKDGLNAYLCVTGASGGVNAVWQPIGLGDVQAVIVTLALLDKKSRVIAQDDLPTAAGDLPDAPDGVVTADKLPAQTWQNIVETKLQNAANKKTWGNVRIYQRAIYLNP